MLGLGLGFSRGRGSAPVGSASSPGVGTIPAGTIIDDGGFTTPPVATVVGGNVQFAGKKSSGSAAKMIYNIGVPEANTIYTLRYDPDFTRLANQGRTAFVGFGFKRSNDFRLSGLKGDGGSGLRAYEIAGDNLWNKTTGFTLVDGGTAAAGTQAGPNWLQLETAPDNSTYTVRTSSDGVTWVDEFTDVVPSPLGDLDNATQFGIAVFLDANDSGDFTVDVTLWTEADAFMFSGALVYKSANQSANFNHTFISWDSEQYDTAGFHDNASNNSRLTVPAAHDGDYVVLRATFQITALQNAGNLGAYFRKNGNIFDGLGNELFLESDITVGLVQVTSQPVPVVTGDYFEAVLFTDDTATTLVAATSSFGIEVVG